MLLASGPFLARFQAGSLNLVFGYCYLPLILFLVLRLVTQPSRQTWVKLAVVWALQLLSSHPQAFWLSTMAAAVIATGFLIAPPLRVAWRRWWQGVLLMVAAAIAAVALLGIIVVPLAQLIAESNRASASLDYSGMFAMAAIHWWSLILGPAREFAVNWEYDAHVGIVVMIGAAAATLQWRQPAVRALMALIAFGGLIAAGESTPLFSILYEVLPGLSAFRLPSRAALLVVVGLVLLATLSASNREANKPAGWAAALIVAALVSLFGSQFISQVSTAWWLQQVAGLVLAGLAWWVWLARSNSIARWGLLLIVSVELVTTVIGQKQLPTQGGQFQRFEAEELIVRAIQDRGLNDNPAPPRVAVSPALVRENAGMVLGYAGVTGFESLSLGRVWDYLHLAAGTDPAHAFNTSPAGPVYDHADRFGSVALNVSLPPESGFLKVGPASDPRAFVAGEISPVKHWSDAIDRMVAGHNIHQTLLVETAWMPRAGLMSEPVEASAEIRSFSINRIHVNTQSSGPAILVLAEAWYPGWEATVNGTTMACFPVNAWMRAVEIPAGDAEIVFRYRQQGLWPGLLLSLLTLVALVLIAKPRLIPAKLRRQHSGTAKDSTP